MKQTILSLFLLVIVQSAIAQPNIIPIPVSYEANNGAFILENQIAINNQLNDEQASIHLNLFLDVLKNAGIRQNKTANKKLNLSLNQNADAQLGKEGYVLSVSEQSIDLRANEAGGIFNGLQTLRQLLPPHFASLKNYESNSIKIPACTIKDYPRFGWRGLMLDVSRHFYSVEEVKTFIDQMAQYKFNVFHWHLTDDEGWRIEIKSLPKLTEVGAWRVERYGRFGDTRPYPESGEKATYGGFYTQEQIKDIIQYATDRNITIVPEIDMPGHSMAALAAYPELSTKKESHFVNPGSKFAEWFDGGQFKMLIENTLNPADEKVYEFVDKVMTEVAALFPGEYIHMGGDECYQGYWAESPEVQAFMKKKKIENTHDLETYFVRRVAKIIEKKGKKMIGWDEILHDELPKNSAVMSWRGEKGGIAASQKGFPVVMSPTTYAYLDYTQGDKSVENPIYANLSLEKAYQFEPIPEGADPKYILGGQGNLWSEVIPNVQFAFYMTYPRAFALSESLWSPKEKKDWKNFMTRTENHFDRFAASQTNISHAVYEPIISIYMQEGKMMCALKNSVPNTQIYYSIDNTYPALFGKAYSTPFEIPEGNLKLRTQTYRDREALGREILLSREELEKRAKK